MLRTMKHERRREGELDLQWQHENQQAFGAWGWALLVGVCLDEGKEEERGNRDFKMSLALHGRRPGVIELEGPPELGATA
ncbi:hypothetical protein HAX54_015575 [Datura stramonium]|uniref:Uncharacterized protein n=1 Tax=Datura stramonium TaxID=4076 RepID=A0ABS8RFX8_DATST|nr:hypothetical protein [Datura stramonium]